MPIIRRIAAALIALSLILPQRACMHGEERVVSYPLSGQDEALAVLVIAALYLLPLVLILLPWWRRALRALGLLVAGAGLYLIGYGATEVADELLVGWYVYTGAALVYVLTGLFELWKDLRRSRTTPD